MKRRSGRTAGTTERESTDRQEMKRRSGRTAGTTERESTDTQESGSTDWRARLKRVPGLHPATVAVRRRRVARDIRTMHDTLETTPLAGRYWVWGGFLLGWAREGRMLAHDLDDVDFAYLAEDRAAFEAAIPSVVGAGFAPDGDRHNLAGELTERKFRKGRARYDFFEMTRVDGRLRYFLYGEEPGTAESFELVAEMPDQELVPFEFLGRTWRKHADHEAELEALYGNWRVPDPSWHFFQDGCIVERRPRTHTQA